MRFWQVFITNNFQELSKLIKLKDVFAISIGYIQITTIALQIRLKFHIPK